MCELEEVGGGPWGVGVGYMQAAMRQKRHGCSPKHNRRHTTKEVRGVNVVSVFKMLGSMGGVFWCGPVHAGIARRTTAGQQYNRRHTAQEVIMATWVSMLIGGCRQGVYREHTWQCKQGVRCRGPGKESFGFDDSMLGLQGARLQAETRNRGTRPKR